MSTTVDQRVVEMRFDNRQFESGVSKTLTSLDRLKQSLNLSGAAKGLDEVSKAASRCDVSGLNNSISTVQAKFESLDVVAATVLSNITASAMHAGKRVLEACTVDPVSDGFSEYELKMGSVQTIMNSTGASLEDVMAKLNELNTYSDKTIYYFADMTSNIGKFTNAGVKLDDAVAAIQGVANVAAVSGANANEASHAMYNFAQALSSGSVKLIDWKSIENANMATMEFKQTLIDTAVELGTLQKQGNKYISVTTDANGKVSDLFNATENFNDSLSHQWMTTDVLTKTLGMYADETTEIGKKAFAAAQDVKTFSQLMDTLKEAAGSGWATTWELIIGNFEEAKELWTGMSNVIGGFINNMSNARNEMLAEWKDLGGRTALFDSFKNIFSGILSVITPLQKAFREIVPPMTGKRLYELIKAFEAFTSRLKISDETADKIQRTFQGLFVVLNGVAKVVGGVLSVSVKAAVKLFGLLLKVADATILRLTASTGDLLVNFREWLDVNGILLTSTESISHAIETFVSIANELFDAFTNLPVVKKNLDRFRMAFFMTFEGLDSYLRGGEKVISGFIQRIQSFDSIDLDNLKLIFKDFKENVLGYFLNADGIFDPLIYAVKKFGADVKQCLIDAGNRFKGLGRTISNFVDSVKEKFSNVGLAEVLSVGIGIAVILLAKKLLEAIDILEKPMDLLEDLVSGMVKTMNAFAWELRARAVLKLSESVAILVGALAVLTMLDRNKMLDSLKVLGVIAAGLTAFSFAISKIKVEDIKHISGLMVSAGIAILLLAKALEGISQLDNGSTLKSLGVMAAIAIGLAAFAVILSKFAPKMSKSSILLISFALSLNVLVKTLNNLASLDAKNAKDTATTLLELSGVLTLISMAISKIKFTSAASIFVIAAGLAAMVKAFDVIAEFDGSKITKNIWSFVGVIGAVAVLMAVSHLAGEHAAKAGVMILAISASLLLVTKAMDNLSKMNSSDIKKGTKVIASMMVMFAALVALSEFAGQNAAKAGAMLLMMSGAMLILTGVITLLSKLDKSGVLVGTAAIVALGLCFAALIKATEHARDCKATLLILAGTIGILAASLGALSMVDTKNLLGASGALALVMGVATFMVKSTAVIKSAIVPMLGMMVVIGGLSLILYSLARLPVENTLGVAASLSILLLSLSAALAILSGVGMFAQFAVTGIATLIGMIVGVGAFLTIAGAVVEKFDGIKSLLDSGISLLEQIGEGLGSFFGSIVRGFTDSATANLPALGERLSGFMDKASPFFEKLKEINEGSVNGVKALAETMLILTGVDFLQGITSLRGNSTTLTEFGEQICGFADYYVNYAGKVSGVTGDAVTASATAAKTLAEFSKAIPNDDGLLGWFMGNNNIAKFGENLVTFGESFSAYATKVKLVDSSVVDASVSAARVLSEFAKELPNSGGLASLFTGDNDIGAFGKSLSEFGECFKAYYDTVGTIEAEKLNSVIDAMRNIIDLFSETSTINSDAVASLQNGLKSMADISLDGFIGAFDNAAGRASAAVANLVSAVVTSFNSQQTRFLELGAGYMNQFITGLSSKNTAIKETCRRMASAVIVEIRNKYTNFYKAGVYLTEGFRAGMQSQTTLLKITGSQLGTTVLNAVKKSLDIHSPSKKLFTTGTQAVQGFANGVKEKASSLKTTVTSVMEGSVLSPISDAMNQVTNSSGINIGGISSLGAEFSSASALMADTSGIDAATSSIEEYTRSLYEESSQYEKDTKQIEKHKKELAELEQKRDDLQRQLKDNSENRKKLSSKEVKKIQGDLDKVEESIKKKNKEIKEDEDAMVEHTKEAYEKMRDSIKSSLQDSTDPLKQSVDSQIKLFEKFDTESEITTEEILENMKSQIDGVSQWRDDLEKLSEKGVSAGLLDELKEMGPSGAKYVKAFLSMTTSELNTANTAFAASSKITSETLLSNFQNALTTTKEWVTNIQLLSQSGLDSAIVQALGEMGTASAEYVNAFLSMAPEEIASFNSMYAESLTLSDEAANSLMQSFSGAATEITSKLTTALNESLGPQSENAALLNESTMLVGENASAGVSAGIDSKKEDLHQKVTSVASDALDGFKEHLNRDNGKEIGKNICNGLIAGIEDGQSGVITAAVNTAVAAYNAAKDALDIESPSKKFAELGRYSALGLAKGMAEYAYKVAEAGANAGTVAIDGLKESISHISDIVNGDIDMTPCIRPVIDLSNVESGVNRMDRLFKANRSIQLAAETQRSIDAATERKHNVRASQQQGDSQPRNIVFEQYNYSPKALSRIEIYRQTKNQFSAAKGVLSEI